MEIYFAAGCFWGIQAAFDKVDGVLETQVGYMGGYVPNPDYEEVCSGETGHAETVRVRYNEALVSTDELVDLFFMIHDPTSLNRQGADVGTQYRSAVFYTTPMQKAVAHIQKEIYKTYYEMPIVTEILPAEEFYPAESYHQKYLEKNGQKCSFVRPKESFWKHKLTPEQYDILRERGTEQPFSGKYNTFDKAGVYTCAGCGQKLFESASKFPTTCGWPGFDKAIHDSTETRKDFSHLMIRNEVLCARCGGHLGHVFRDGPTPTGLRYCINSAALDFKPERK